MRLLGIELTGDADPVIIESQPAGYERADCSTQRV
jgi:hypothetical protein